MPFLQFLSYKKGTADQNNTLLVLLAMLVYNEKEADENSENTR